ncbi:creatininase family protein [uncultured Thermanaerothrix sp.]|uniref:creatininase family protein n=1 Tax=uncultured Thermanaerothrix sp. TaxID=1195149 RepID=UPI00260E5BC8|nr:creatininase family protein [uncultured Thermanaerothrix sp.]
MRLEDLNWMDVEEYLRRDDRVILVLGACEQHGYLSLLTDVRISMALADAASRQSGVLVAPPLNFGISPYFLTYPGTISLRTETFVRVVEDIVQSLYHQGFRRFVVLNGHGGNIAAQNVLTEIANRHAGMRVAWYAWWQSHSVEEVAARYGLKIYHAGWAEAFPFTRVTELPSGEKRVEGYQGLLSAEETRTTFGDGVFGGAYQVDDAILEELFDVALQDVLALLNF